MYLFQVINVDTIETVDSIFYISLAKVKIVWLELNLDPIIFRRHMCVMSGTCDTGARARSL